MAATIEIKVPDTLAKALGGERSELPQRTVEAATLQLYGAGTVTHAEVGEILGLSRWETDALLKRKNIFPPGFEEEFADDLETIRKVIGK